MHETEVPGGINIPCSAGGRAFFLYACPMTKLSRAASTTALVTCVDFENSFHLGKEAVQQPEVAARDPDDSRDRLRVQRALRKMNAGRRPELTQQVDESLSQPKGRNSWTKPIRE